MSHSVVSTAATTLPPPLPASYHSRHSTTIHHCHSTTAFLILSSSHFTALCFIAMCHSNVSTCSRPSVFSPPVQSFHSDAICSVCMLLLPNSMQSFLLDTYRRSPPAAPARLDSTATSFVQLYSNQHRPPPLYHHRHHPPATALPPPLSPYEPCRRPTTTAVTLPPVPPPYHRCHHPTSTTAVTCCCSRHVGPLRTRL